ncbi:RND family efflux transporter, MFP subunit [Saccharicrinis carchari]|uniref:RND family efflux transporter, MFP subunit n=1 Tax=Saccharicrinis carchari TaxID=1168039 RepID=A0A521CIC5_SACCC|nr:efflux RND transporter periplasmic adaptor subunit [Saccharicrinis carchari]SMO59115.1 RND family efflux transporter, MFP subunit [Saccharicrinis carchari]
MNYPKQLILTPVFFVFILLATSCGNEENKTEKLAEHKKELLELKKEISALEDEIEAENGTSGSIVNVTTRIVRPQTYNHFIEVTGKVKTDQNTMVSPEGGGKITRIVVTEGERVSKGQVLAHLNNDAIESQIEQVKAGLQLAVTTFERRKKLWDRNIGSEIEYLQAKAEMEAQEQNLKSLQAQQAMSTVKSQINGIVDEIFQRKGEIAGPSIPFARVVNIDEVYVNAEVGERFVGMINDGDSASVFFPALDKNVQATIFRSSTVINDISRTFRVRINLKNSGNKIKPNLISVVKLKVYSADNLLIVPSILVKQDFDGEFLFVTEQKEGKTYAKKQYVKSVFNTDNKSIISEGLKDGDTIVTQGYNQIVNGTEIKIVNS